MPNWVYSGLQVSKPLTKKQEKILSDIQEFGICQYYLPVPKQLEELCLGYVNGQKIVFKEPKELDEGCWFFDNNKISNQVELSKEDLKRLEKDYGFDNPYDWKVENWNTKWGDCRIEVDFEKGKLNWESAWSPIGNNILDMFSKDFPDFNYKFVEEQDWGGEVEYRNGSIYTTFTYNTPEWELVETYEWIDKNGEENEGDITKLLHPHPRALMGIGYYLCHDPSDFLAFTLAEAKNILRER